MDSGRDPVLTAELVGRPCNRLPSCTGFILRGPDHYVTIGVTPGLFSVMSSYTRP